MIDLANENRLLVWCIQSGISESAAKGLQDILKLPLNWEEFLASAQWQGVTPLIYRNIKDLPENLSFPREVMEQMKEAYYATLARNMLLYAELRRILDDFREEGLEVILLKGAALAKIVYADIGMRPMGDIDIMVRREDIPKAERRLSASGYVFHGGNSPEWWREHHYHLGYSHPEKTIQLELHWHITNELNPLRIRDFDFDIIDRFWEKAGCEESFGDNVRILSPEDTLLYLSIHFLKHRFYNAKNGGFTSRGALLQLSDILYTLKNYGDDFGWERLGKEAEEHKIYSLGEFVSLLVMNIMGERKDCLSGISKDYQSGNSNQEILELMTKKIFIREEALPYVSGSLITVLKGDVFQHVAGKMLRDIFPSPEVMSNVYAVPLRSKRLYLYYIKRPFDLFLKHRRIVSAIPRMKEDVILNKWIDLKD